jgi:hypothetical protein
VAAGPHSVHLDDNRIQGPRPGDQLRAETGRVLDHHPHGHDIHHYGSYYRHHQTSELDVYVDDRDGADQSQHHDRSPAGAGADNDARRFRHDQALDGDPLDDNFGLEVVYYHLLGLTPAGGPAGEP